MTTAAVIRALPLIRRREGGGWERLIFGSLIAGKPRYEPVEWDEAAYREKQRRAAKAREQATCEV